jgi:hypothetical protein
LRVRFFGLSVTCAKLTISFAATAVVTIVSIFYIYRKMLAVRKKVLIGMRRDLTNKGVNVSEMPKGELSGRDEA